MPIQIPLFVYEKTKIKWRKHMRTQTQSERLQRIVTLSEINLYHLDKDLKMIEKFVLFPDVK